MAFAITMIEEARVLRLKSYAALVIVLAQSFSAGIAEMQYVPLKFHQVFGTRPFVNGRLDGKSFELMIHASASSTVEITPETADALGHKDRAYLGAYGIDRAGHVSVAGLSRIRLGSLEVGPSRLAH